MDFREKIRSEYIERKKRNPNYSMRAFASSLSIDQSLLSKILSGVRKPSTEMILKVSQKLGFNGDQVRSFLARQEKGQTVYYDLEQLEADHLTAHWEHYAIFELVQTKTFKPDIIWIAKRLGLSKIEVEAAVKRLETFGLLKIDGENWSVTHTNISFTGIQQTNEAKRFLQKKYLEMAHNAIDKHTLDERFNGSLTIQCSPELLPAIKRRMDTFINQLEKFIASQGPHDDVYQVVVGCYPLTTPIEKSND
ncbi:MAG: TIGR02147 family protein [Bdellovibrionales bacterium]